MSRWRPGWRPGLDTRTEVPKSLRVDTRQVAFVCVRGSGDDVDFYLGSLSDLRGHPPREGEGGREGEGSRTVKSGRPSTCSTIPLSTFSWPSSPPLACLPDRQLYPPVLLPVDPPGPERRGEPEYTEAVHTYSCSLEGWKGPKHP